MHPPVNIILSIYLIVPQDLTTHIALLNKPLYRTLSIEPVEKFYQSLFISLFFSQVISIVMKKKKEKTAVVYQNPAILILKEKLPDVPNCFPVLHESMSDTKRKIEQLLAELNKK